jgi:hypothetical protein
LSFISPFFEPPGRMNGTTIIGGFQIAVDGEKFGVDKMRTTGALVNRQSKDLRYNPIVAALSALRE